MTDFKPAFPKPRPFNCNAAFHLQRSPLLLAVYVTVGNLTSGGKTPYFTTMHRMAQFLGRGDSQILKAFRMLRKLGWLTRDNDGNHWFVTHEAWAKTFGNDCSKVDLLPWQETLGADPLVSRLYAASSGKLRLYERTVDKIHELEADDEFVELYRKEIVAAKAKRARGDWSQTSNESCLWRVIRFLKERQRSQVEKRSPVTA